jgi:hypothetical protein
MTHTFKIIQHNDIHGAAIAFSVVNEHGDKYDCVPSEAEAMFLVLYHEALAEDAARPLLPHEKRLTYDN